MSTAMMNNSSGVHLVACRTCLSTERKLYSIYDSDLSEAYKHLIGFEASPYDGLPQYVCNYCGTLLLKFKAFKNNSQQAQNYLEHAKIILPDLWTTFQPITLQKSDIKIVDSTHTNDIFEPKIDLNYEVNEFDPATFDHTNDILDTTEIEPQSYNDFIKTEFPDIFDNDPSKIDKVTTKTKLKDDTTKLTSRTNSKSTKSTVNERKRGKYFETDENLRDFERDFNVDVIILSHDQQMKDVLERKLSSNYLQSPYKCELCYKGVMDEESLKKHVLYQHDPSRGSIVCNYCSFRYKDKRGLNQHLKSHRLKFACKQCTYVSRTTFNAKEHFKMHTGHTHQCRHCGKSYEKLSSHLTHLRIHHPSHFIWCDICGEAFIGQFGLNAHKKRAHRHLNLPYECTTCNARFTTELALNQHTTSKNCSSITCVHCGDAFDKDMDLRDHLLEKHRSLKIYECEKCNKTFSRQSLHSAHYRRAHIDAKDKQQAQRPWVCEVCGKTLPNRCLLLYHQRNHTGERPYQCTECNKSFTMRKLLQSHLKVHTSDRPYACKACPKTFKGLSALRAHEYIHTGGQKKTVSRSKKVL